MSSAFARKGDNMRKFILALMAVTAAGAASFPTSLVTSTPAAAQEYPWCVQGRGVGYPGECMYSSRAQCMASASGRLATCGLNPRAAYGWQRRRPAYRGDY
jgi:uncharacterized protein DUF3551